MLGRVLSLPLRSSLNRSNSSEVAVADGDLGPMPDPRLAMRYAISGLAAVAIPVVLLTVGPHLGPGIRYADVFALCVALASFAIAALFVPWQRLQRHWLLYLVGVPIVFVAALNSLAGAGQSPYFVMYAPLLAIAGWYLSGRQTVVVIGFVVVTEVWRAAALDRSGSLDHLAIALPFVVVIAATASLTSHWLRDALVETRRDQLRMAHTLDAVRQFGTDPHAGVLTELERAAARMFDANATVIRIGADRPSDTELTPAIIDDRTATVLVSGADQLHALLRIEASERLSAQDVRMAAILAEAAGRTLDAQLAAKSMEATRELDSLTALPNRRALERDLAGALVRQDNAEAPDTAVLFVDIDDFRGYNEAYGDAAGDALLLRLAAALRSSVRPGDAVYRVGGDEFALLLRGSGPAVAPAVFQRVREAATRAARRTDNRDGHAFSISIGMALPGPGDSVADLLAATDEQMFLAKQPVSTQRQ